MSKSECFLLKKHILLLLFVCSFGMASAVTLHDLPWVKGNDADSIRYAIPYLPKCPVIIEAGVYDGEDTVQAKKIWPNSVIYGFEPNPTSYQKATNNTRNLPGIKLFPYALSNHIGKLTFYVSKMNAGCSSLLKDNFGSVNWVFDSDPSKAELTNNHYHDTAIEVATTTLNSWRKQHHIPNVDYIWLDTEGAELQILSCATTILPTVRVISTEVNFQEFRSNMTQFFDLYQFLTEQGFSLKYIWGNRDWQGVAMFINNRFLDFHPEHVEGYIIPEPL